MKNIPQRKPTRLNNFNYSCSRFYFVTICTKDRNLCFGNIVKNRMHLSKIGGIVDECWREIPKHFPDAELKEFIIMPDHFHGILKIHKSYKHQNSGNKQNTNVYDNQNRHAGDLRNSHGCSLQKKNLQRLPVIIGCFKSSVTRNVNKLNPDIYFAWQKSYYDRIIRTNGELKTLTAYIMTNPITWRPDEHVNDIFSSD